MSASMSHSSSAEPNLTPILDMVFQLITFFMLVINFKTAAMDLDLRARALKLALQRPRRLGTGQHRQDAPQGKRKRRHHEQ